MKKKPKKLMAIPKYVFSLTGTGTWKWMKVRKPQIELILTRKDAYKLKQMLPKIQDIYLSGMEQDARRHILNKLKRSGIK